MLSNTASDTALATVDASPYFERTLRYALQKGIVDATRLESMKREGAKGVVQLATFFSTAHLRPELEAARTRLITLVSLALEADSGHRLEAAAQLLSQKSLLALSKSGADRLRQLLALPVDRVLGDQAFYREDEKTFLSRRTLEEPVTFSRYLSERSERQANHDYIELSYWLADRLGLSRTSAQDLHISCESLLNSALLVLFVEKNPTSLFSAERFTALHEAARKKRTRSFPTLEEWIGEMPDPLGKLAQKEQDRFLAEVLPVMKKHTAIEIRNNHERFAGLFFFDAYSLDEITHHDQQSAEQWAKLTGQHGSHTDVQCTVLLMVATGQPPARSLRKKDAVAIWEQYRAAGFDEAAVTQFIDNVVPFEYQADLMRLWREDLGPEAQVELDDDDVDRALDYLHDTCRGSWKKRPS